MAREPRQPAVADLVPAAIFHALADPVRLEMVRRLAGEEEMCCMSVDPGVAKSTLSNHWRVLREAGLARVRVEGRNRWMSLRRADLDARFPGLLDAVLSAITPPPTAAESESR